jgi:hypothetical protein
MSEQLRALASSGVSRTFARASRYLASARSGALRAIAFASMAVCVANMSAAGCAQVERQPDRASRVYSELVSGGSLYPELSAMRVADHSETDSPDGIWKRLIDLSSDDGLRLSVELITVPSGDAGIVAAYREQLGFRFVDGTTPSSALPTFSDSNGVAPGWMRLNEPLGVESHVIHGRADSGRLRAVCFRTHRAVVVLKHSSARVDLMKLAQRIESELR